MYVLIWVSRLLAVRHTTPIRITTLPLPNCFLPISLSIQTHEHGFANITWTIAPFGSEIVPFVDPTRDRKPPPDLTAFITEMTDMTFYVTPEICELSDDDMYKINNKVDIIYFWGHISLTSLVVFKHSFTESAHQFPTDRRRWMWLDSSSCVGRHCMWWSRKPCSWELAQELHIRISVTREWFPAQEPAVAPGLHWWMSK